MNGVRGRRPAGIRRSARAIGRRWRGICILIALTNGVGWAADPCTSPDAAPSVPGPATEPDAAMLSEPARHIGDSVQASSSDSEDPTLRADLAARGKEALRAAKARYLAMLRQAGDAGKETQHQRNR